MTEPVIKQAKMIITDTTKRDNAATTFPSAITGFEVTSSTQFASYPVIKYGEVKAPRGMEIEEISIEGTLPGEPRKDEPYVYTEDWYPPMHFIDLFKSWQKRGVKLKLSVTGCPISAPTYYLDTYTAKVDGGYGDYTYALKFIEAGSISASGSNWYRTYKTKRGDTLYKIAKKMLRSGKRYKEIAKMNHMSTKKKASKTKLKAGKKLKIPLK
ncbi:MAG: LysM peptidoglycan-binding domain-containing protein [Eubacteriaceae bacterium]|nr:LysM peptidoglycan-binding domain-containing protein [Eubacteriaceae bacterium]